MRFLALLLSISVSAPLAAQATTQIGSTSVGNPVLLETRSVKKSADGIVTATVRATFLKPVKAGATEYRASRTIAMFNCTTKKVAVKENWYYSDEKGTKVASHKVVGIPGYGTTIKGSLPDVAMAHLCKA
jgi:acyl-coenzyme A thioesterase PaaI-like protein